MIVGPAHLTYCTNIHPGETWPEVRANLAAHVLRVKAQVAPDTRFGVGLRLSAQAARSLAAEETLAELRGFLDAHDLYVFTINGFPHGTFHGTRVKEDVYRPDWLEEERLAYTDALAHLLAQLLPPAVPGSVSTVPLCFRPRATDEGAFADMADRILRHAAVLVEIERDTGRRIALALEPEPFCVVETVAEAVSFFEKHVFSRAAARRLAALTQLTPAEAEEALRRHLGLCLDACHAAVEFETPEGAVAALRAAGIAIAKVQVSAGLRVEPPTPTSRAALRRFAEDVYLHQVVARAGERLRRYADLPEALEDAATGADEEWRIHFHVPLFHETLGPFRNTQGFLRDLLQIQARDPFTPHLEVETYTWHVLPPEFRGRDVTDDIARELQWTLATLRA